MRKGKLPNTRDVQASVTFQPNSLYGAWLSWKIYISTIFANQKKSKKNFCFNNNNNKKAKSENSIQCLFCSEPLKRQRALWAARVAPQAPSQGNSAAPQHRAARALTCVCEYPLYLNLFCAFIKKLCPKVIAFSLYTILAYKMFHRNALLSDSGENLYNNCFFFFF